MSSKLYLDFKRFSKRGKSDKMSATAMRAMTSQAYSRMILSEWIDCREKSSDLPPHDFLQSGFKDTYDAAKYCGDYSEGKQSAYACAVCYTFKVPAGALTPTVAKIEEIAATVYGDRWNNGGSVLSAIINDSEIPPSWDEVLTAPHTTPDPVTEEDSEDLTWQPPLRKITRSNSGVDSFFKASVPLAGSVSAARYIHLLLRLGDYLSTTGAWIEGGSAIDGSSIAVTFDATGIEVDADGCEVKLPLRMVGKTKMVEFSGANKNLYNSFLRMQWGLKMLTGGLSEETTTPPVVRDAEGELLSPRVMLSGLNSDARGYLAEFYCPTTAIEGGSVWLTIKTTGVDAGESPLRISIFDSKEQPSVTRHGTWTGAAEDCIGTSVVSGLESGKVVEIKVGKNASSSRLWIACSFSDLSPDDKARTAIGFNLFQGLSLADAHISKAACFQSESAPPVGWLSFVGQFEKEGMFFETLRNVSPQGAAGDELAISETGSATIYGTSYGEWVPLTVQPESGISSARVRAGRNYFMKVTQNGSTYYSGDIANLLNEIELSGVGLNNKDICPTLNGFVLLRGDGTCKAFGNAIAKHQSTIAAWTGIEGLRGDPVLGRMVGINGVGRIFVSGFEASAKNTLEALTGVYDVQLSRNRLIILKGDLTVTAYSIAAGALIDLALTWTNMHHVAATNAAVWGINDMGVVSSYGHDTDDTSFFDVSRIPSGGRATAIIGSSYRRLALSYYTS